MSLLEWTLVWLVMAVGMGLAYYEGGQREKDKAAIKAFRSRK